MQINRDKKNISYSLLFLLGISLPLSIFFTNYLFVLAIIILFFNSPRTKKVRWLALFVLMIPALIPVLSIFFHSETLHLSSIEVKIPFVVVGLVVAFTRVNDAILSKFKLGFVIGSLIGGLLVVIKDSLFVTFLTTNIFLELTYTSLYLVIALIYLWFTDIEINKGVKLFLSFTFLVFLIGIGDVLFITAGLITTFAAIIIKANPFQSKLAIGVLVVLFSIFIYKGAEVQQHLQQNNASKELSGVDKLAQWKCVLSIMQNKELFGVGFISKDMLLTTCYGDHAMFEAESNALNSHNEYLDAFLTLGYIGVLALLIYFLKLMFVAYDTKQVAQLLVIVLIALFSISENVFTRQKGVMVTAITCLLIFSSKCKKLDDNEEPTLPTS